MTRQMTIYDWARERNHALYICLRYPDLQDEVGRLMDLKLPGAFTGKIPDTPEAKAARQQINTTMGWYE